MSEPLLEIVGDGEALGCKLLLGYGENGSYDAARRGQIIIINTAEPGKKPRLRAPVRANLLRIAGNDPSLLNDLVNDLLAKLEAEKLSAT